DRKLSSVSDQIRDRLHSEYNRIIDEANHIEEQNELATTRLTERHTKHLDEVAKEVNNSISALAAESRRFIQDMIDSAKTEILKMGAELTESVAAHCDKFNATVDSEVSTAKSGLNSHNQRRLTQYNEEVNTICAGLDTTLQTFLTKFTNRFEQFRTRLSTDIETLVSTLDSDVLSISEEIEGSWSRASEKLGTDSQSFELWIAYIVNRCEMELKQSAKSAYLDRVLPRLTENKDIFRSMLLDMRSNFSEQSEQIVKRHSAQLDENIEESRESLVKLVEECVAQIDSIGKGQQDGLDELFVSTRSHLEEVTGQVEEKLESARREILKHEEEANRLSESSRIEDEPQFRDQKNAAVSTLHDARGRADKELESAINASCRRLEELSEELQDDLVNQRTKLAAQAKTIADGGIAQIKQAIQDAYHSIEAAKEKYME
ncbi:MAG: hypothetical protein K2Z81_23670, partial [Cyanobacteria bacterium]|nr:hypothetical protein [Cyanobacteriota bacterium]